MSGKQLHRNFSKNLREEPETVPPALYYGVTDRAVTVQVGDGEYGDTVGNFLKEVSHTLQELSKQIL